MTNKEKARELSCVNYLTKEDELLCPPEDVKIRINSYWSAMKMAEWKEKQMIQNACEWLKNNVKVFSSQSGSFILGSFKKSNGKATMRTIKFRGKRTDNGEWVYGWLADGNMIADWSNKERHSFEVKATTVGQYTGLTDRYGKEIYEGDIIEAEGIRTNVRKIVKFEEDRGCWIACRTNGSSPDFDLCEFCGISEIRGNIHDNTELLK